MNHHTSQDGLIYAKVDVTMTLERQKVTLGGLIILDQRLLVHPHDYLEVPW